MTQTAKFDLAIIGLGYVGLPLRLQLANALRILTVKILKGLEHPYTSTYKV